MDLATPPPFTNEPFTDFSTTEGKRAMLAALERVRSGLGESYDLVIGGHHVREGEIFHSINPAKPSEIVGTHFAAAPAMADQAVAAAQIAFPAWARTPVATRANLLLQAAKLIRQQHLDLCAWLVFEVGKNWAEADADVGECIDFLEFYAREALRLEQSTTPIQLPGERNRLHYLPLGVGAIIPPWNFPLAIMAGMTCAAIVTGNTVVLKPSPDAPTIAARFLSILERAGMPQGVVNLLQGGAELGRAITEHKQVRFIAFTGSKKVGLEIHERAARTHIAQNFIRRTILEMGGKDAIIVAADADIDAAVEGVTASAFGFSGQKCSACSRVIVEEAIYDAFVDLLRDRVEELKIGDPVDNFYAGPVINEATYRRVLQYIDLGRAEGRLLTGGAPVGTASDGYFLQPTIFTEVASNARLAQEEIFGPLLSVLRANHFDHALQIANHSEYGLTGAVYSASRHYLDRAKQEFHVGNLYLNRKCTGAMVGAHPFGGFNMSGTDSKAGGPDYLTLFTQAKSIAEKLGSVSLEAEEEEQRMGI